MTSQAQPLPNGEPGSVIAWSERRLRHRSRTESSPGDVELRSEREGAELFFHRDRKHDHSP